jgi:hypothetical protein
LPISKDTLSKRSIGGIRDNRKKNSTIIGSGGSAGGSRLGNTDS